MMCLLHSPAAHLNLVINRLMVNRLAAWGADAETAAICGKVVRGGGALH